MNMQKNTSRIITFSLLFPLMVLLGALTCGSPSYAASAGVASSSTSAGNADSKTLRSFFITGKITSPDGKPVEKAEVILVDGANRDTLTKADGSYSFELLRDGTYTVVPRKAGMKFLPDKISVTINGDNKSGADFTTAQ
jgi:hypothetical protein